MVDDLIELDALTKLGGQIVAAGFMVLNDVKLCSIKLPGVGQLVLDPTQAGLLTILLVVGTMNAVNFVDGLDGLAGGVVLIGAVAFFLFSYRLADSNGETLAITAAMLCAAMGGRLRRLPAAQLLPGPDLHGRLGLDAARPRAGRLGAHASPGSSPASRSRAPAATGRW